MRMPILAYFAVIGAALLALLNLSAYALPDVGSPIKTSQITGLPKVAPRPDAEPLMPLTRFAAAKEPAQADLPAAAYAKADPSPNAQSGHVTKRQQTENKQKRTTGNHVASYSYAAMMSIH